MSNGTTPERPTPHQEAWTFWLGASADAETGSRASTEPASGFRPTGFDPARICRACGREVCLTNTRMFCGCRTMPWEIQEDEE